MGRDQHSAGRVVGVCIAFAVVHSLLASRPVKCIVRQVIGGRSYGGLYRVGYAIKSMIIVSWGRRWFVQLPDRELYRFEGPLAWLLYGIQLVSIVVLLAGVRVVGFRRFVGVAQYHAFATGKTVPATPEAQGPPLAATGAIDTRWPFCVTRHPENLPIFGVFWCFPRMTVNHVALAAALSVYMILGAMHEDHRLRAAYGEAFERYARDVPFMLPRLPVSLRSLFKGALTAHARTRGSMGAAAAVNPPPDRP
jgi:protein-S-isoprenylcysteine O-methyltransferase Ste14